MENVPAGSRGRCFLAVRLDDAARDSIATHAHRIEMRLNETGVLRWVQPELFHVTLRFLGHATAEQIDIVRAGMSELPRTDFELTVASLGAFPSISKPRVLWFGASDTSDVLHALHERCESIARDAGFEPEKGPYRPHLTIARVPRRARASDVRALAERLQSLPQLADITTRIRRVALVRSVIGAPPSPRYVDLETIELTRDAT